MSCPWCDRNEGWWQATLYVLGELDAERTEAFEEHMKSCQLAREAVAEAVLLTDALEMIEPGSVVGVSVVPPRRHGLFATWAPTLTGVLSLAATVALVALVSWWASTRAPSAPRGPIADLALRWAALQSMEFDDPADGTPLMADPGPELAEQQDADRLDQPVPLFDSAPDEERVPDWMLAAMAVLGSDTPDR